MTLSDAVEAALGDAGLPVWSSTRDGYLVVEGDNVAHVYWRFAGQSDALALPFPSSRLAVANIRLAERGFCCGADEQRDRRGYFVHVTHHRFAPDPLPLTRVAVADTGGGQRPLVTLLPSALR